MAGGRELPRVGVPVGVQLVLLLGEGEARIRREGAERGEDAVHVREGGGAVWAGAGGVEYRWWTAGCV